MRSMILAAALLAAGPADAFITTYSQWEGMPEEARVSYIMGMFDGMVEFGAFSLSMGTAAYRYSDCLQKSRMDNWQLAANLRAFVAREPFYQTKSVALALLGYLAALCGPEPSGK